MKKLISIFILIIICSVCKAQDSKTVKRKLMLISCIFTLPPQYDTTYIDLDSINVVFDKSKTDSTAYYTKKYKHFMALYTNSIGFKEVKRMSDSCRHYYELLNRKK